MNTFKKHTQPFSINAIKLALLLFPLLSAVNIEAASLSLATSPLATSTTSSVKPNLLFIMDDSGSMKREYMPDTVSSNDDKFCYRNHNYNGVYYNPGLIYSLPIKSDGSNYPNSSFTNAQDDGYSGTASTNLSNGFRAGDDGSDQAAYYYKYTGTSPATPVPGTCYADSSYTRVTVSSTSGPGSTDERQNFANWYSYYRTRLLTMKTAAGLAFSELDGNYRVGMMKISQTNPIVNIDAFSGTHRDSWFSTLYGMTAPGSTPLRRSLSDAGRYYAGKLSGITDPMQYSCQQNFTILSTDGYWNSDGGKKLDDSTMDNQDGNQPRPYYDGSPLVNKRSTSQINKTQIQTSQSTSQNQKRELKSEISNLQRQISQLQIRTGTLQTRTGSSSTAPLETRTSSNYGSSWSSWSSAATSGCVEDNGGRNQRECRGSIEKSRSYDYGATWTAWADSSSTGCTDDNSGRNQTMCRDGTTATWGPWTDATSSCTVSSTTDCQYLYSAWNDATSCTPNPASPTSPYTVLSANECQEVVSTAYQNVSSCTENAIPDASGQTTQCSYSSWVLGGSPSTCTDVPQDTTNPFDMTASSGIATRCTDTGWVGASSCTYSSTTGYLRECQTVSTGPTLVSSCTAATPSASNSYTLTSCNSSTILAATPVGSCTPITASASNSYVATTCNTVSSGPTTVASCTEQAASLANNWTATTCTTEAGTGGTSNTLADVAMYYYQTDLRTTDLGNCTGVLGEDVCANNVFLSDLDKNTQQHMTTFTLGMGADGRMAYSPSYLTDTTGDYPSIKKVTLATASVCTWQSTGTTCNWPIPSSGDIENIDDLWHAAVNGHGAYFSAKDPTSLSSSLAQALAGINSRKGAAAAAATSTLNPVAGNNYAFVASYTTLAWKGNLEARGINTLTGAVNENAEWCVENVVAGTCASPSSVAAEAIGDTTTYYCVTPNSVICTGGTLDGTDCKVPMATSCAGTMSSLVGDVVDSRTIKTANSSGDALIDFSYASLTGTQQGYFSATKLAGLSQWATLDATQQATAAGTNLVNYLRGQYAYDSRDTNLAANRLYRYREAVMGDALESEPAFMGSPVFNYPYPGYSSFKSANTSRSGIVYIGANDGMMHAFYAKDSAGAGSPCVIGAIAGEYCGGEEAWAYVPSMVMEGMWKLADTNYATSHKNFVNGSPTTSDVCVANCADSASAVWKTILVAGLSGGGRGYYALDITDPANPTLLWEFTTMAGLGAQSGYDDDDVGYSFGHPIITRKQDGTWVVLLTSGYNNTSPGSGKSYLYVMNPETGAIISKIGTGAGSLTTPSGLSHIVGWNDEPAGNLVGVVYGGDLQGNLWRFDINSTVAGNTVAGEIGTGDVMLFATLKDQYGVGQPITTTPVLGKINEKRVVFVGTGKYLETSDLTDTQLQSIYAIKDDNATATLVNARNSLVHQTIANSSSGASRNSGNVAVDFYSDRGWYIDLPDTGERVNIDSTLVQGTLIVPSIVPSNTSCSPGGYGWLNYLDYRTGGAVNTSVNLVAEKTDSTIVGVNVLYIGGEPKVGVVTSTNPTPTVIDAVSFAANAPVFTGKRVIWRELIP
ncbi:MAG: hypothetical protein KJ850_00650 [Gammaproteobacteria bacterium]|nr:hypothetical protein [Gammaproteobacteria bacterium]MBU1623530.1 hypothetical protein [Gammaproteobacteria bacterium]